MVFNSTFNNYIVVVSFIGVGNQSTRKKPQTCRKKVSDKLDHIILYRAYTFVDSE